MINENKVQQVREGKASIEFPLNKATPGNIDRLNQTATAIKPLFPRGEFEGTNRYYWLEEGNWLCDDTIPTGLTPIPLDDFFKGEECPDCGGGGIVTDIVAEMECCGYTEEDGSCCNNPRQVPRQVQEQCRRCEATGTLQTPPPQSSTLVEPELFYPVIYTVMQDRQKVFYPQSIKGKELTEPQIKYLLEVGYFDLRNAVIPFKKPFYVDTVRKLIQQYDKEEISLSKLVEVLNEKATGLSAIEMHNRTLATTSLPPSEEKGVDYMGRFAEWLGDGFSKLFKGGWECFNDHYCEKYDLDMDDTLTTTQIITIFFNNQNK